MSPSPQGYRQPWEEPSPEREVFDEMLRRPYEELHAENERLYRAGVTLAAELQVLRVAADWEDEHGGCECRTCIAAVATALTETDSA